MSLAVESTIAEPTASVDPTPYTIEAFPNLVQSRARSDLMSAVAYAEHLAAQAEQPEAVAAAEKLVASSLKVLGHDIALRKDAYRRTRYEPFLKPKLAGFLLRLTGPIKRELAVGTCLDDFDKYRQIQMGETTKRPKIAKMLIDTAISNLLHP